MDIIKNIHTYRYGGYRSQGIQPLERYASFDYCFNYFQAFREQHHLHLLTAPKQMQVSCLQLGYYLASWGMLRGSSFLLSKSVKVYEPVIEAIASTDEDFWMIDTNVYTRRNIQRLLDFKEVLANALPFKNGPSDILTSKIMLGVFGNVPAFDRNFTTGFGVSTFGEKALRKIANFYADNQSVIDEYRLATVDFAGGAPTGRLYTRAKVIDMIFFIEGSK